jgi:hypothetical protein
MLLKNVKVGEVYEARVGGRDCTVRVTSVNKVDKGGYGRAVTRIGALNLTTGRQVTFKSAAKLLRVVKPHPVKGTVNLRPEPKPEPQEAPATVPFVNSGVSSPSGKPEESKGSWSKEAVEAATEARAALPAVPAAPPVRPSTPLGKLLQQATDHLQARHIELQAYAGTGKTTSIVRGVMKKKGMNPGIVPSPQQEQFWTEMEVGKGNTMRISAFNTAITNEVKNQLIKTGLDKRGVEARGIHSLGYGAVTKAFGKQEASNWAVLDILGDILGGNINDIKKQNGMTTVVSATDELVGLCKQTLTEPTPENLDQLASHYDVDLNSSRDRVYDLVPQVLDKCRSPKGRISFDDMVWLPVVLGLPIYKVDDQIIDESQDLNRMQQELMYRAGHRITFVGDNHQAIYGFAGADAESMARMSRTLAATSRGLVSLPLTVTRRCGKAIVEEARQIVPDFEAHESNPLGMVTSARYPVRGKSSNYWTGGGSTTELKWEESYLCKVQPGDMVLCRVNAPLVSQCFKFLRRKIPANIQGRKIGEGLITMINKSKATSREGLMGWLEDWLTKETALENAKKYPGEDRLIALQDKYDCLSCFVYDADSVDGVKRMINDIFTDNKNNPGVRLSSIHKSKGLEAANVFLLEPEGATVPHPMAKSAWQIAQEWNLRYVAITRAIESLTYVS